MAAEGKKAKQSKQAVQADLHSESWFLLWIIPDKGWSEVPQPQSDDQSS
jgi:hypothetical protein